MRAGRAYDLHRRADKQQECQACRYRLGAGSCFAVSRPGKPAVAALLHGTPRGQPVNVVQSGRSAGNEVADPGGAEQGVSAEQSRKRGLEDKHATSEPENSRPQLSDNEYLLAGCPHYSDCLEFLHRWLPIGLVGKRVCVPTSHVSLIGVVNHSMGSQPSIADLFSSENYDVALINGFSKRRRHRNKPIACGSVGAILLVSTNPNSTG